jgi:hypothetical protein
MQSTDAGLMKMTPVLTVTDSPSLEQLRVWWDAMQQDDLAVAFADTFPSTLGDFQQDIARGEKRLLLCLSADKVAGALWLHDMVHGDDGTVRPAYRGRLVIQGWRAARQFWEATGVRHFFSAVHMANRRCRSLVVQAARFRRVGKYPAFLVYDGQPADAFIYTLHPEDTELAWHMARVRKQLQEPRVA